MSKPKPLDPADIDFDALPEHPPIDEPAIYEPAD